MSVLNFIERNSIEFTSLTDVKNDEEVMWGLKKK